MSETNHVKSRFPADRDKGSIRRPGPGKPLKKPQIPLAWTLVIDVLIAAVLLFLFSLYYFILPSDESQNAIALPVPSAFESAASNTDDVGPSDEPAPSSTQSAAPSAPSGSPAVSQAPADTSAWGAKFPGKFTDGKVEKDDNSYKSGNINISIKKYHEDGATYFVADIYVKDLKYFQTALAHDKFGRGQREGTGDIAKRHKALLAINGDFSSLNDGPVVRNGILYRKDPYKDVLVMKYDGTMQTYSRKEFDIDKMKDEGIYQVWTFGPMLLKDGKPMKDFNVASILTGGITDPEPRTAIGYYEPGHYCFVVVDGRQGSYSHGHTLQELSKLFADLGCKVAFNLDGGKSSEMVFRGNVVNKPFEGGRDTSDIIMIADK